MPLKPPESSLSDTCPVPLSSPPLMRGRPVITWWACCLWNSDGPSSVLKWRDFELQPRFEPWHCVILAIAHNLSEPPFARGQNGDSRCSFTEFLKGLDVCKALSMEQALNKQSLARIGPINGMRTGEVQDWMKRIPLWIQPSGWYQHQSETQRGSL